MPSLCLGAAKMLQLPPENATRADNFKQDCTFTGYGGKFEDQLSYAFRDGIITASLLKPARQRGFANKPVSCRCTDCAKPAQRVCDDGRRLKGILLFDAASLFSP